MRLSTVIVCCISFLTTIHLATSQNQQNSQNAGQGGRANAPSFVPSNSKIITPQITGELLDMRRELMYPYNLSDFTDITSGKPIHDQALPFRLPFFGFEFTYVYIQKDGYLAFNKGLLSYKFPLKFPMTITDPLIQEDPSLISPWFSLQDIPNDIPHAGVYFKIVNIGSEMNVTLRDRLVLDFREGMIGAANFIPKYAMIITWRNLTMVNRRPERELKTNTYQAVIATDEIRTYAMFNYEQIQWLTHMDNYDGLKGTPAFVGFNAGNTTRAFEFQPYSQNPRISLLTQRGFGNGLDGRFFFQIDEEVWPGACIEKDLDPNMRDRLPLTFFPRWGHMLGGTLVNITGPCLNENSIIACIFENFKVEGYYRDANHATCISPAVPYHGYVDLTISVDDRTFFLGRFYMQPPDIADENVIVLNNQDRLEFTNALPLKWHPDKLAWDNNAGAEISLWGYRESSDLYPTLTFIDILERGVRIGDGLKDGQEFQLDTSKYRERDNGKFIDITYGFISINLTDPTILGKKVKKSPIIWSRAMPLAWYFRPQWEREYGRNGYWKTHLCEEWVARESDGDMFARTLHRCPCTLKQAILDRGRFAPDLQCNVIDRKCDTFHRGAQHCVTTGRPSIGVSGQTCCYDDQGELLQSADTMYGGRPSRAFQFGKHPFKMRMMIPSLSHWLHDVMPFFFCCKWQPNEDNAETCQKYNYWRTSQDCSNYQVPAVASVFGDPHIITFDQHNYTFNGKGEFTLVHVDNPMHILEVQARFEQVPRQHKTAPLINATQLTAIAASDNQSSIVEFRVRPKAARWRYHMYVIVDKEYVFFWDDSLRIQNFKGVTLFQPAGFQNMSHIIAMFDSGAGIEVITTDGHMTVHVYAPLTFLNGTAGLLGRYSRDVRDDFTLPNKKPTGLSDNAEEIHRRFGMEWRVTDKQVYKEKSSTLFYHDAATFAQFDDPGFIPEFQVPPRLPENMAYLEPEMRQICSDSAACRYDYVATLDKEHAKITKMHESWANTLTKELTDTVVRCPALEKPKNGKKSDNRYAPGILVRFSCDDGYRLVGYEARQCRHDGLWSWGVDPECISNSRYYGKIVGATVGIIAPVIIFIVCIVLCIVMQMRQRRHHYTHEPGTSPTFAEWKIHWPLKSGNGNGNGNGNGGSSGQQTLPLTSPGKPIAEIATTAREADL